MRGRDVERSPGWKLWTTTLTLTALVGLALSIAGCSTPAPRNTAGSAKAGGTATTSTSPSIPTTTTTVTPTTTASAALSLLVEPQAGTTSLDTFMSSAHQSLDMTMYELSDTAVEQILIADHRRGVRVRVLLDREFSGGTVNQAAYSTLSSGGVPVAWADASRIFHQKTVTVDGAESAIMTGNLTPKYYATTRDFVVMDNQPADVAAIESSFATDWTGAAPAVGSPGVDLVWSPGSEPQLAALISSATRTVMVENEEMASTPIEDALEADSRRGVNVTVVMTADTEWDTAFAQLESAGVHVVLYPDTSSALYIHAKVIDVDGAKAFLGSENFSTSSLDDNRELGLITASPGVVGPLNSTLSGDISGGQPQQGTRPTSPPTTTPPLPSAAPTSPSATGCSPIDNEGGCYEPGEYCRNDDHGATGRAGDGLTITCEEKNGSWYWEAA
jgi:cardiolipin synthase A/B